MKKTTLTIVAVIAGILLLFGGFFISTQNAIIGLEEKAESSIADIDTQLKRRSDLIPNLVNTVKGYMRHEESIIKEVTDARERMLGAKTIEEKGAASQAMDAALKNLNVVVENYPDLKASANFVQLQDELAGTENRIATARHDYNEAVRSYNSKIKSFPSNIVAGMMGKSEKAYFAITPAEAENPTVDFNE